ncbi:MAG: transcriptional regulator [Planctomycetota bacterium]
MVPIHEKIVAQLEQRRLKKRDLARALGVSPQTATDICKGRSAITLPHLRNLVAFFDLRADFWIDDQKRLPEPSDRVQSGSPQSAPQTRSDFAQIHDVDRFLQRVRALVTEHHKEFLTRNPDLTPEERRALGLGDLAGGSVGRVSGAAGT